MKSIMCKLGFHKLDRYRYERVRFRNGKHKWHRNYHICKRCGKRLQMFGFVKVRA